MANRKPIVSITLSPGLDVLELVVLKATTGNETGDIDQAVSVTLPPNIFDPLSRQLQDTEAFKEHLSRLFETNRIPFNSPSLLTLPSFFTRETNLEPGLSGSETRQVLISEAERSYVFKKLEPQIAWIPLPKSMLPGQTLYSALPATQIEQLCDCFQALQIPLIGIELNYLSIIRGLVATGAIQDEVEADSRWVLLVLGENSLCMAIMEGSAITLLAETPLAAMSGSTMGSGLSGGLEAPSLNSLEETNTLYQQIQEDFAAFFYGDASVDGVGSIAPVEKLVLVNNTTRFSGDLLIERLDFPGIIILVEQTPGTLRSRGATEGLFPCSLEAIGGVFLERFSHLPHMNFAPESSRDWMIQGRLKGQLKRWLIVANGCVLVLIVGLWLLLSGLGWWKNNELSGLVAQEPDTTLGGLEGNVKTTAANAFFEIKRKLFVKTIQADNIQANDIMVKTGVLLPPAVWLQKLELKDWEQADKRSLSLTGGALQPEAVNEFMNQLSKTLNRTDLEVSRVDLVAPTSNTPAAPAAPAANTPETNPPTSGSSTDSTPASYLWMIQQKGSPTTP